MDTRIRPCYCESMMSRIDTLSDLSALQQMKYVEFIVFIARISFEIFQGTKNESLLLHLKIDKILGPLLGIPPLYLAKLFTFKEELEEDEESSDGDSSALSEGMQDAIDAKIKEQQNAA